MKVCCALPLQEFGFFYVTSKKKMTGTIIKIPLPIHVFLFETAFMVSIFKQPQITLKAKGRGAVNDK